LKNKHLLLVVGSWLFVVGSWLFVVGSWFLMFAVCQQPSTTKQQPPILPLQFF
jgi:hypothetical protein